MLTTTGCLRLCNSGLLTRTDVHGSVSRGQLLTGTVLYLPRTVSLWDRSAEDIINAYLNHICCTFGPSRKILTDNGTEFKNQLWTEVYKKLQTEHKVTPIYSPQCNGRIEGFHRFLKSCIAKQLENRVEWDDLVWKATAAYNFFPTESSGMAPFFLMFGREANVKHNLLASESPKYMGTDDSRINLELMNKLYLVIAHNLHEARKARDKNTTRNIPREADILRLGDNVLVRDHTSKVFQPKYKDFCVTGFLGKNQIEVKDNHGHTTKVHRRDVKKIPMTDKICQMYEEEQANKTRNGRKLVPDSIMPKLSWNLEKQEVTEREDIQQLEGTNNQNRKPLIWFKMIILIYAYTLLIQDTVSQKIRILAETVRNTLGTIENFSRTSWTRIQEKTQAQLKHVRTYREHLKNQLYGSYDYVSGCTTSQ